MVRSFFALMWLCIACPALAGQVSLSLQTDSLMQEQRVTAVITVVGYRGSVRPPSLVVPEGLGLRYVGPSEKLQVINGTASRTMQFVYEVEGQQVGAFTLGPADVFVDGVTETTNAVALTVTERVEVDTAEQITAFASFTEPEVFEGQVVLYHYGLRSRLRVFRDQWTTPPMDRLQAPRDGLPRTEEYTIADPTGSILVKETWYPMLATAAGDLGQIAATAQVSVSSADGGADRWGMRRMENRTLVTEPAPLLVKPLPPPPPGFTGLVGDFELSGRLNAERTRAGNSVTYSVTVTGDGSLEGFALPEPPDVAGARFYDNTVGAQAEVRDGAYIAHGQWQRVIVPTQAGELQVPPLEVVSFSPSQGRYITHRLEVPPIRVAPGAEGTADVESYSPDGPAPAPTETPDNDIRPILRKGRLSQGVVWPWLVGLGLVAGAPAVGVYGARGLAELRRRRALRPQAERGPLERLSGLQTGTPEHLAALDAALRDAVGRAGEGMLAAEVSELQAELGRARFAGASASADLDARVRQLVQRLMSAKEAP